MDGVTPKQRQTEIPRSVEAAQRVAASLGLAVPAACLPGVIANLALLDHHAAVLRDRETS